MEARERGRRMSLSRRSFLTMLGAAALASPSTALPMFKGEAVPFSPDWLKAEAQRLAGEDYAPMPEVPETWKNLTYDQYKALVFNTKKALWSDTDRAFQMDFFHPGLYFPRPIEINIVEGATARKLGFDLSLFKRYDPFPQELVDAAKAEDPMDSTLGYSGLRLRHELTKPGRFEEFMVFQGASYFRAIGTGQTYGLSARGLALNTGEAEGEEFPEFTRFWVEAPSNDATTITVHALLDGPSTTGAYSFRITPGHPAHVTVEATLYPRTELTHVGLAPLTSMFLFDQTNRARFDDFREAVHDSEGLLVWNGAGEMLWRPLANPSSLQVSSFVDTKPRGFGLMQRARHSEDYADLEALYHNRPSLWITPRGDWGQGAVTLVEIPSDKEIYDNIVAYWRPRDPMAAGQGYSFAYDMAWGGEPTDTRPVSRVLNSRIGKGYDKEKPYIIMAVDFADHEAFGTKEADLEDITRFISANRGTVSDGILQRNDGTGGVRLAFKFEPGDVASAELRVQLVKDGKSLTEVWLYRWTA
ncbi:glucans biosynthesis protein [Litoreibacter meonggei]|uniref:Glucans biosynthesis protein n=2 Tax=Litoreibacter meonggei TaxID=1049199 RepID=A0A497VDW4_9RHOB|nr:glucans biosynthesis protein [Litoreibacter meonggei]